jgi:hypothetical protein
MKAYRQGELLFVPQEIKDMDGLKKVLAEGKKTTVVAEGEATGHKHELADPITATLVDIENANIWIDNENPRFDNFQKVIHTENGTVIKHPDHDDLKLPGGTYYVRTQREFDEAMDLRVRD